jgi:hypothetical protein
MRVDRGEFYKIQKCIVKLRSQKPETCTHFLTLTSDFLIVCNLSDILVAI